MIAFHNVLYSTIPFAIAACWETRFFSFAATNLALVGILGLVTFGNYVIYYAALRCMPVWRIRTLLLTVPALGALCGRRFLARPSHDGPTARGNPRAGWRTRGFDLSEKQGAGKYDGSESG